MWHSRRERLSIVNFECNTVFERTNVECTMHNVQLLGTEIHIVDMYGRWLDVVETQNIASLQTAHIDISDLANGVYFVKLVAEDKTIAVRKVVKQ